MTDYRAMGQQLGQPVYTRPAPSEASGPAHPIVAGWVPQTAADLPAFEATLDAVLAAVRQEVLALAQAKGAVYQDAAGVDSCFRRGLPGLFHNLARKWDRIEVMAQVLGFSRAPAAVAAEAAADNERDPETVYRTVRDLAVYAVHTLRWLQGERHGHGHDSR